MKKQLLNLSFAAAILVASCGKDKTTTTTPPVNNNTNIEVLEGDISANKTLSANKQYMLKGFVYVTNGATLTIEPGTIIKGDKETKGSLVITRGAKINAIGTADKPIVFTSEFDAGSRREGDWGGVILLGKAPINPTGGEAKIEGGLTATGGGDEKKYIYYGGTETADNSGTMKYVRIEFAGMAFSPDNEINGLTMGGVGNGTTLDYIQVYRSGDDAFEWFGGTVNAKHLIATNTWDDDFDTDFGFSGKVQFGVAQRFKNIADISGSNGFESDNDANGSTNAPQTKAVFTNMTIVGPINGNSASGINGNFQHGAQIRRNSSESIFNSIIMGFPLAGIYIDDTKGTKTSDNVVAGNLKFAKNIIAGCPVRIKGTWSDLATYIYNNNDTLGSTSDVKLKDAFKYSAALASGSSVGVPSFLLDAGSPAATGASFSDSKLQDAFFTPVTYRGAFDGSNDWTAGWTNWAAESTDYKAK
jgi:hypothetical protein